MTLGWISLVGLLIGIARLSRNWLVARFATVYVETLRNIPVLLDTRMNSNRRDSDRRGGIRLAV